MGADDAEDGREAQAAPGELGREEGIEHAGERRRAHAVPCIRNFQTHAVARRQVERMHDPARDGLGAAESGHEADFTGLFRDRLRGVDHEIHHHLADL